MQKGSQADEKDFFERQLTGGHDQGTVALSSDCRGVAQ